MNEEYVLQPCPFCGDSDVRVEWREGRHGLYTFVQCGYCGAQTRTCKMTIYNPSIDGFWEQTAIERVVKLWNKREA